MSTTPEGKEVLLPCPFCGGPVFIENTTSYYDEIHGHRKWWGVVCRNTINVGGTCAIQQRPSASEKAAVDRWNRRAATPSALSAAPAASGAVDAREQEATLQNQIDAVWVYAQLYAEEHAASIDPLRTHAAIEGAKRRKTQHEVALRQSVRELAALASRDEPPAAAGAAQAVADEPMHMLLCEFGRLVPRPNVTYRPIFSPGCAECERLAASQTDAYGARSPTHEEAEALAAPASTPDAAMSRAAVEIALPDPARGYTDVALYSADEVREIVRAALKGVHPAPAKLQGDGKGEGRE